MLWQKKKKRKKATKSKAVTQTAPLSGCCVESSEGTDGRHITSRLSNRCC